MRRAALLPPPVFSATASALLPFKHDVNSIVHIDSPWLPNTNGNPLGLRALATDGVRLGGRR